MGKLAKIVAAGLAALLLYFTHYFWGEYKFRQGYDTGILATLMIMSLDQHAQISKYAKAKLDALS